MASNGEPIGEMSAPAPKSAVAAGRFWILEVILSCLIINVVGTYITIKNALINLFKSAKSVKGKVVVITGSGRGLGRGVALALSKLGAHIACVDINTKTNEETAELIRQQGGKAEAFTVNVAKSQQIDQLSKDVAKKLGPADIIINNAALVMAVPMEEMSYDDIRAFYEVNVMSAVFMTKAFLPDMKKRNSGHIVSISSIAAKSSLPWLTLYCSTKAGVSKFMDTLLVELNMTPNNNIKVSTIHPYFINTSADYFKWFKSPTPVLEESTVVDAIVDAILFDKASIIVPRTLSFLNFLDGMLPHHYWNLNIRFLGRNINVPTKKERENLPYGRIVSQTTAEEK